MERHGGCLHWAKSLSESSTGEACARAKCYLGRHGVENGDGGLLCVALNTGRGGVLRWFVRSWRYSTVTRFETRERGKLYIYDEDLKMERRRHTNRQDKQNHHLFSQSTPFQIPKMASARYESEESLSPEPLAQPLQFQPSGRVAKNRFLKSPMAESLASWSPKIPSERGIPSDGLIELYKR